MKKSIIVVLLLTMVYSWTVKAGSTDDPGIRIPHFAVGGGWETVLVVQNISEKDYRYDVVFYSNEGKLLNLRFTRTWLNPNAREEVSWVAFQSATTYTTTFTTLIEAVDFPGQPTTGWLRITQLLRDNPATPVSPNELKVSTFFRLRNGTGDIITGAAVLPDEARTHFLIPNIIRYPLLDHGEYHNTGFALLNPSSTEEARVTIRLRDQGGARLAEIPWGPLPVPPADLTIAIPPLNSRARFISEYFPRWVDFQSTTLPKYRGGAIEVVSNVPLYAVVFHNPVDGNGFHIITAPVLPFMAPE